MIKLTKTLRLLPALALGAFFAFNATPAAAAGMMRDNMSRSDNMMMMREKCMMRNGMVNNGCMMREKRMMQMEKREMMMRDRMDRRNDMMDNRNGNMMRNRMNDDNCMESYRGRNGRMMTRNTCM